MGRSVGRARRRTIARTLTTSNPNPDPDYPRNPDPDYLLYPHPDEPRSPHLVEQQLPRGVGVCAKLDLIGRHVKRHLHGEGDA